MPRGLLSVVPNQFADKSAGGAVCVGFRISARQPDACCKIRGWQGGQLKGAEGVHLGNKLGARVASFC